MHKNEAAHSNGKTSLAYTHGGAELECKIILDYINTLGVKIFND